MRSVCSRESPMISLFRNTFSRPVNSGLNPAPIPAERQHGLPLIRVPTWAAEFRRQSAAACSCPSRSGRRCPGSRPAPTLKLTLLQSPEIADDTACAGTEVAPANGPKAYRTDETASNILDQDHGLNIAFRAVWSRSDPRPGDLNQPRLRLSPASNLRRAPAT